jgi:eukaryotic-like serine/threonine-protein kinase
MDQDTLVGLVLNGTYRVERRLGGGGMGAVFACRHARTGRAYAVKILLPELSARREAIARFRREAETVGRLGHAGIVGIHDFDQTADGLVYIVMDLLEGEDLGARLLRTPRGMPWAAATAIVEQVGSALTAAHAAGVIHRDLKPANVFLATTPGAPERAVLLDFGLAKAQHPHTEQPATQLTQTGAVMGTPAYMSPEQAIGQPVDQRTDLYSLGAVLFELVTGEPPFSASSLTALLVKIVSEEPPQASERSACAVPAGLDEVLARAMAKSPSARYATAAELVEAVRGLGPVPAAAGGSSLVVEPAPRPAELQLAQFPGPPSNADGPTPLQAGSVPVQAGSVPVQAGSVPVQAGSVPGSVQAGSVPGLAPAEGSRRRSTHRWILAGGGALALIVVVALAVVAGAHASGQARRAREAARVEASETAARERDAAPTARSAVAAPASGAIAGLGSATTPPPEAPPSPLPTPPEAPPSPSPNGGREPARSPSTQPVSPRDAMQAARQRAAAGDFRGCLRALRGAPGTLNVLQTRLVCATRAGDAGEVRAACAELQAHHPLTRAARACGRLR